MELSADGEKAVCPYCGHEMLIEKDESAKKEYERRMAKARAEQDIEDLRTLIQQMHAIRDFGEGHPLHSIQEVDVQFHIRIAKAANNEILKAAVINLEKISMACAERIHKSHAVMERAIQDHQQIFDAIVAQDPDAAERAIVAHTLASKEFLSLS